MSENKTMISKNKISLMVGVTIAWLVIGLGIIFYRETFPKLKKTPAVHQFAILNGDTLLLRTSIRYDTSYLIPTKAQRQELYRALHSKQ